MARRNTDSKITAYRRYSWLNIGTILFGAIFLYMVITLILYLTADHIKSYEVTAGSISGNYRYTAIALKNETVVSADFGGYVTYYARNGAKASSGSIVCAVDEHGAGQTVNEDYELTSEDLNQLKNTMQSFSLNFDSAAFENVYNFKADILGYLLQASQSISEVSYGLVNMMTAPLSGFVSYTIDGMEELTEEDISAKLFERSGYRSTNLRLDGTVRAGDDVYKIISGEDWTLYFPVTASLATQLQDRTSIRFRFLKDDTTFTSAFQIIENNGDYFGKISLRNSLVRYVSDRYLEIELLMDGKKGLKIPASSIDEKYFCKIPQDYVMTNNGSDNEVTLLRETFRSDGSTQVSYLTATVYDRQDRCYLVSPSLFETGDYVQMADTAKKHQITEEDFVTIQGVYNINKGYAVFREVTVIDENEEFCIVEPYNPYGLAAHDFIVLDASAVNEDDIVY